MLSHFGFMLTTRFVRKIAFIKNRQAKATLHERILKKFCVYATTIGLMVTVM